MTKGEDKQFKYGVIVGISGALAVMLMFFGLDIFYAYTASKVPLEQVDQTFYVSTPAGEAFEVKALHHCGEANMRKAAIHVTQNQDRRLDKKFNDLLATMTMDYARIYEGHITDNRCEITGVIFTNITGKAYIVGEE